MKREQKLFDTYSLVIGVIAAIGIAILVLALKMPDLKQGISTPDTDKYQAAVADRIRPVGQFYSPGEGPAAAAPTVVTAVEPEPVVTAMSGPQVYNSACIACHGSGIGGAPALGDAAAWAPRIAQGLDVLTDRAIVGFMNVGYMPPKGARADLSDEEVGNAVQYMVSESQ